jgi:hypothetical protein
MTTDTLPTSTRSRSSHPMPDTTPAQSLRAAAQRLRAAEDTLTRTAAAAAAAEPTAEPNAPDVARLSQALEDVAAAHALGEADAASVKQAAAALAAAQASAAAAAADRAAADAATAGLRRRLQQAEADAEAAREALDVASREWLVAEMATAEAAYLEAVAATAQAHGRHAALAAALDRRGARLPNPVTVAAPLVLPTIGLASCATYSAARPNDHGMGANLVAVLPSGSDNPDAELSALIASPKRSR